MNPSRPSHPCGPSPTRPGLLLAALTGFFATSAFGWTATGTVKTSTGTPLSGVMVSVKDSAAKLSTTTDGSGAFLINAPTSRSGFTVQRAGNDLLIERQGDGVVEVTLHDLGGVCLWKTSATLSGGQARIALQEAEVIARVQPQELRQHAVGEQGRSGLSFLVHVLQDVAVIQVLEDRSHGVHSSIAVPVEPMGAPIALRLRWQASAVGEAFVGNLASPDGARSAFRPPAFGKTPTRTVRLARCQSPVRILPPRRVRSTTRTALRNDSHSAETHPLSLGGGTPTAAAR